MNIWKKSVIYVLASILVSTQIFITYKLHNGNETMPAPVRIANVQSKPPAFSQIVPSLLPDKEDVYFPITVYELQKQIPYDIYVSRLNLDKANAESCGMYFYYFENGEMNALRTILHAPAILKEHYPRLESIVFHVEEARKINNGFEPVGGLGLINYQIGSKSIFEDTETMLDSEVKETIRKHYRFNAVEFSTSWNHYGKLYS